MTTSTEKREKAQRLLDEAYERTHIVHLRMLGQDDVSEDGLTVRIGVESLERLLRLSEIIADTPRGYLTEDELEALAMSGKMANRIRKIIGDGPQSEHDWAEAAQDIHKIQHTIMAQAAARAYPDKLRLLGGVIEGAEGGCGSSCGS